jgi:hypothetical protein
VGHRDSGGERAREENLLQDKRLYEDQEDVHDHHTNKTLEIFHILLSNAFAHPRAVVVQVIDTAITILTMGRSFWLIDSADITEWIRVLFVEKGNIFLINIFAGIWIILTLSLVLMIQNMDTRVQDGGEI